MAHNAGFSHEHDLDNVSGDYDNQFSSDDTIHTTKDSGSKQVGNQEEDSMERSSPQPPPQRGRVSSKRRYLKRTESIEPPVDKPEDTPGESLEMHTLEAGLNPVSHHLSRQNSAGRGDEFNPRKNKLTARHRRTQSYHHAHHERRSSMNGFDYYNYIKQHRRLSSLNNQGDLEELNSFETYAAGGTSDASIEDNTDVFQNFGMDDIRRTRKILSTIRIRRKSRKRTRSIHNERRRSSSREVEPDQNEGREEEEEYMEEVGLPSARPPPMSLTQRRLLARQLASAKEAARQYRETLAQGGTEVEYTEGLSKKVQDFFSQVSDIWDQFNFWSHQFKEIEGRFGIATSTYFRFTRWLVKVNFLVFFLFLCFLYIPQLSYDSIFKEPYVPSVNSTGSYEDLMFRCSNAYNDHIRNVTKNSDSIDIFLDVAQGTGYLENTMLFYGYYSNLSFWRPGQEGREFKVNYNMGLGYLLTVGISFIAVFVMIVKNSSSTIKEAVMDFDNKAFPQYTNAVFGGWDFCIKSEQMAFFKHKIIYNEFKSTLEEKKWKQRRENRTAQERVQLYTKRVGINLAVIALLGGSFVAIAFSTNFMLEKQKEVLTGFDGLIINYLPSIVISVLNLIVPEIFMILCDFEEYSSNWKTRITILRAVVLRLASVWVLVVALYNRLQAEQEPYACPEEYAFNASVTQCCGNSLWQTDVSIGGDPSGRGTVKCWETYVGQQFYKLSLVDFISITSIVLLIGLPRKFLYNAFKDQFSPIAKLGKSKFDLPIQVLDIVYSQTLCWIGMFFTPLLPAITFFKVFIFFFLKKFELLYVAQAPDNAYEDHVMFSTVTNEVNSWSSVPRSIVKYFGTVAFFLPAFLILLLAIYYYSALSSGYRKMEKLLKQELKSEAHDKQFLLARVDEIIKKGQLK
ncbi:transmembrane channel-like protein [Plakobranchus ocellatus]|uniref:Transmembrane channel-like protein n=1 Tax=Plakobranchus ocellatus TaxID=259542 RepID=A0AAV4AYQ6_9GAST|nr:transmembrane channel-like protein [Plakobranchus ocellatus]